MQDPKGVNWRSVPTTTKELYWGEFQNYYTWDKKKLSTSIVKKLWLWTAGMAYRDYVCGIKRLYYRSQKDRDKITLQDNVLKKWVAFWETEEAKAKSIQARKNRFSEPAGPGTGYSIHHGGSRCAELHVEDLAKEKGVAPTECLIDLHMKFHYKEGIWTNCKAEQIMKEVERRKAELPQPVTLEQSNKIYLEVNMRSKKGRILGQGNLSQHHVASASHANYPFMTQPIQVSSDPAFMEMKAEVEERKKNEEELRAELTKMRQEMQSFMESITRRGA